VKRLNGMDAMLLYSETPNLHTHTLKVLVIDAGKAEQAFNFDVFRRYLQDRLHDLTPLRYTLVDVPWRLHHPTWRVHDGVDLSYHLRRVQVEAPGGRRELDELIGRIASTPLDRNRPLWEFHFVEGLADDRFALVGKVHHSLADGVASANLLSRLMGLVEAGQSSRVADLAGIVPTTSQLLRQAGRDHIRQITALPRLLNDAARGAARLRRRSKSRGRCPDIATMFNAPPTFLNHEVSPTRTFTTVSLPLRDVKQTAKSVGATFTDVVMAVAAGGLRELLLRYDGRADRPLLATVPISTDGSSDRLDGNEISGLTISLPVHIDSPLRRVSLIRAAATAAKEDHELLGPTLQGRMMGYLPPPLAPAMFHRQARRAANRVMNVAVSTVRGPSRQGTIAGAPVSEIYSVGVLSSGSAFNMTAWSYGDQVDIAVLSDDRTFNDTREAAEAMIHAFAELQREAGLNGDANVAEAPITPTAASQARTRPSARPVPDGPPAFRVHPSPVLGR
jgi:diacylglycerol O-acyltransferase / wax synthase